MKPLLCLLILACSAPAPAFAGPFAADLFVAESLKTGLRFIHFIALAIGLGGATLLDLMLVRFCLLGRVSHEVLSIFDFTSKIITAGLVALWISGLGFLLHYGVFDAEKLTNPKVHAKLVIVAVLTLNGILIHRHVLPFLAQQVGKPLFSGISKAHRSLFLLTGAVSVTSWYTPVALGVFWQLNFTVTAEQILSVYILLIVTALAMGSILVRLMQVHPRQSSAVAET